MLRVYRYPKLNRAMLKIYRYPKLNRAMLNVYRYPMSNRAILNVYRYPISNRAMLIACRYPDVEPGGEGASSCVVWLHTVVWYGMSGRRSHFVVAWPLVNIEQRCGLISIKWIEFCDNNRADMTAQCWASNQTNRICGRSCHRSSEDTATKGVETLNNLRKIEDRTSW